MSRGWQPSLPLVCSPHSEIKYSGLDCTFSKKFLDSILAQCQAGDRLYLLQGLRALEVTTEPRPGSLSHAKGPARPPDILRQSQSTSFQEYRLPSRQELGQSPLRAKRMGILSPVVIRNISKAEDGVEARSDRSIDTKSSSAPVEVEAETTPVRQRLVKKRRKPEVPESARPVAGGRGRKHVENKQTKTNRRKAKQSRQKQQKRKRKVGIKNRTQKIKKLFYTVEAIRKHRTDSKGEVQYYVKWDGYPENQNTWEPAQHLKNNQALLAYLSNKKTNKFVNDTLADLVHKWKKTSQFS